MAEQQSPLSQIDKDVTAKLAAEAPSLIPNNPDIARAEAFDGASKVRRTVLNQTYELLLLPLKI